MNGGDYSTASDVWAVGDVAGKLLGVERFTGKPISRACKVRLSALSLRVLCDCSAVVSSKRPSIKHVLEAFRADL